VISVIVLLFCTYGCQTVVLKETIDHEVSVTDELVENEVSATDKIVENDISEPEVSKDEIVKQVLETVYSVKDTDYSQDRFYYTVVLEERQNEIERYFSDRGFNGLMRSRMILGFIDMYEDYKCISVLEDIELDFRETSDVDEMVCYYKVNHRLTFEETAIEPFEGMVSGEMTLHKYEGEWQIDFFSISNSRSYRTSYYKHIEESNTANKRGSHSKDEIDNIINQILSEPYILKIINDDMSTTITREMYNYLIIFEDSQIKYGVPEGGYDSVVYYDDVVYSAEDSSLTFHINGVRETNYDEGSVEVIDADYFDKIIMMEEELIYLYKYGSDEMKESRWRYNPR